jgi:hypothetical protein
MFIPPLLSPTLPPVVEDALANEKTIRKGESDFITPLTIAEDITAPVSRGKEKRSRIITIKLSKKAARGVLRILSLPASKIPLPGNDQATALSDITSRDPQPVASCPISRGLHDSGWSSEHKPDVNFDDPEGVQLPPPTTFLS